MDKKELKITADGSHTLFVPGLDETYHSSHGAIQEALHVFIEAGFNHFKKSQIDVLEIGFGTGLNAFLTLLEAKKSGSFVNYTSLEAFPLELNIIEQLNYTSELNLQKSAIDLYYNLHEVEWESVQEISKYFSLTKNKIELNNYYPHNKYDLIYFDAFGPRVQPEMWIVPILQKMYDCLNKDGVLVTYCAKGTVKRGLKEVGFNIESLPGPPGKREMTRAVKS